MNPEPVPPAAHTRLRALPVWVAWTAFALALIFLFVRLGLTPDRDMYLWLSSDTLYPVNVFTDIFGDGFSLSGWRFSIAPCWFPDMLATGVFLALTHNVILATLLAGFFQIAVIAAALHVIGKAVGYGSLLLQDTLVLITGTGLTLFVATHTGLFYPALYQFFLPQTHVGSMLAVLFGWAMALWMVRRQMDGAGTGRWITAAYALLCLLAGMSNLLFFAHMLMPVTLALGILSFFRLIPWKAVREPLLVSWPAAIAGALLNRILFHVTDVTAQSGMSPERIQVSFTVFREGFLRSVSRGDLLHLLALLWMAVCCGYLVWFVLRVRAHCSLIRRPQVLMAAFFLISLLSGTGSIAAIVLGGTTGLAIFRDYYWSMHYLHQVFLLPLFGLPAAMAWGAALFVSDAAARRGSLALAGGSLAITLIFLIPSPLPVTPVYAYRPPLVRFLDGLAKEKNLRYGYAGYWQARLITLLSQSGLRAYQVQPNMKPLLWVSNEEWYRQSLEDRRRQPEVDFVVLDDPLWKLTREAAVKAFGEPVSETRFETVRILIYGGTGR